MPHINADGGFDRGCCKPEPVTSPEAYRCCRQSWQRHDIGGGHIRLATMRIGGPSRGPSTCGFSTTCAQGRSGPGLGRGPAFTLSSCYARSSARVPAEPVHQATTAAYGIRRSPTRHVHRAATRRGARAHGHFPGDDVTVMTVTWATADSGSRSPAGIVAGTPPHRWTPCCARSGGGPTATGSSWATGAWHGARARRSSTGSAAASGRSPCAVPARTSRCDRTAGRPRRKTIPCGRRLTACPSGTLQAANVGPRLPCRSATADARAAHAPVVAGSNRVGPHKPSTRVGGR